MFLSESLVWALEGYDISGVKVCCDASIRDDAARSFLEDFSEGWEDAMAKVEEEYEECESAEVPVEIYPKEYGFFISVGALDIRYSYGDYYDIQYSSEAFETALKNLKEAYPQITYEGYIGYPLSDLHYGDAFQWELSSESDVEVYDFVGEILGDILASEQYTSEESEFWEVLAENLAGDQDFAETIKVLYAYAEWIKDADFDEAVRAILDIAYEYDEELCEELYELLEKLESGEEIEEEESTSADLPDGYMEALEMFIMAEELSGIRPKRGEVISSEGTFDVVIAKAEAGDAKAKLTAAKYFIAEHVEEETERAIRWMREAADAGIAEAKEYIMSHEELFDSV